MTPEDSLIAFQIICYERIIADAEYFGTVAKFRQDKGVLTKEIEIALSTLTAAGGKIGSAVIVQSPVASIEFDNVPGSPLQPRISFRVLEDPLFNMEAANGTLKPALETAKRLALLFHLFGVHGMINPMVGEKPTIVPVQDDIAPVAYEVRFNTTEANATIRRKVAFKRIIISGSTVTPTTATFEVDPADAEVYYTLDGTYPRNGQGTLWDGITPVAIPAAATLLASAYKTGYIPSDLARQDYT